MMTVIDILLAFLPEFAGVFLAVWLGLRVDRYSQRRAEVEVRERRRRLAIRQLGLVQEDVQYNLGEIKACEELDAREGRLVPEVSVYVEGWQVVRDAGLLVDFVDSDLMWGLARYFNDVLDLARLRDRSTGKYNLRDTRASARLQNVVWDRFRTRRRHVRRESERLIEEIGKEISRLSGNGE